MDDNRKLGAQQGIRKETSYRTQTDMILSDDEFNMWNNVNKMYIYKSYIKLIHKMASFIICYLQSGLGWPGYK